ncbi:hypothetical protein HAX54_040390, partial [Datura stramonium]|nr:hypothetical protein [Datura stramonium]
MTVAAQVKKSGQQLTCKEAFKRDGMDGVGGPVSKNSSATKANEVNSNCFSICIVSKGLSSYCMDQYDDITEIDKSSSIQRWSILHPKNFL